MRRPGIFLKSVVFSLSLFWTGAPVQAEHALHGLQYLEEIQRGLIGLAEHTLPSVVNISPYVPPSPSIRRQGDSQRARPTNAGAGVIFDGENGYLVTNSHVVKQADKVTVKLYDEREFVGKVVGYDEETDLAVVKIENAGSLREVQFGDSSQVKVGQIVVAIGNPYGLNGTFSMGVVSGLNRENINISRYEDFIQTDASINPGNSGGPLLNIQGEVIGINTAIINYAQSIGFAIPSNVVKNVSAQIIENGHVQRGWLGVGIENLTDEVAKREKIDKRDGVLINAVFENQPAEKAGLKVGDVILRVGGVPVNSPSGMIRLIGNISPGQFVHLVILRNGERKTVSIQLASKDSGKQQMASLEPVAPAYLGMTLADLQSELVQKYGIQSDQGVMVEEVTTNSPAEQGGVRAGDLITAVNGRKVASREELETLLRNAPGGGRVTLLVERDKNLILLKIPNPN